MFSSGRIERYVRKKGCVLLLFTIDGLQTTEFENKQGASGSNDGMEGEHRANLQLHHPSQQWLRKAVYEQYKNMDPLDAGPCTVMHVRRSDVVLHTQSARKYFPVSAYVRRLPKNRKNKTIFLLTDDANAIDEAHEFFPDLRWRYLNRTRWRGTEGGWENQTPSRSPKLELVVILATLRLVGRCDALVHSSSSFSKMLERAMRWGQGKNVTTIQIDRGLKDRQKYSLNNTISHNELNETLHGLRGERINSSTRVIKIGQNQ